MRRLVLFLVFAGTLFAACKKQHQLQPGIDYEPGMLLVGIKANAPMQAAFTLANNLGLGIKQVNGFVYKSPYAKDSIASLANYLNTKKYIDTFQWKAGVVYTVQGYTAVECTYQYMDTTAQQDWINTMQQLRLTEVIPASDTMKDMFLTVPVGQEQALMKQIQKDPSVSWVELDDIRHYKL